MLWLDRLVAGMLAPLAVWVLASGLDDLFLDLCYVYFRLADRWRRRGRIPAPEDRQRSLENYATLPENKIALLIPAWREASVIEQMLEHNIAAIRYSDYEIFVGVYPNDIPTLARVLACREKYPRLHHVMCPHDGPTSKADCLNWLYQGALLHEENKHCHFQIILHHDAEDLIHPEALIWANHFCQRYDMVQVPVLPLSTPWWEFTHGTYCDEFAESQLKYLPVRQRLGGFVPSCGVGTAYRRRALDRLAWNSANLLFQQDSLTEDYHIGLELHRLGCSQILLDVRRLGGTGWLAATRGYFPRRFRGAVRQKARWLVGIAFQSWQKIGWDAGAGQLYWLWRDRKGLVGYPLTILANLIFLYGLCRWVGAQATGQPWHLAELLTAQLLLWWILAANTILIVIRQASRAACVRAIYGWRQALVSPVRSVWGNFINFASLVRALGLFGRAQLLHQSPRWLKTEHSYPSRQLLMGHKRRLGELIVEMRLLPRGRVEQALASLQPGERLGEHLVRQGALSESQIYRALGLQQNLPFEPLEVNSLSGEARDRLPLKLARTMQWIPVRTTYDKYLLVAGPEFPTDQAVETISRLSGLKPRFQLITPSNYGRLCEHLDNIQAGATGS